MKGCRSLDQCGAPERCTNLHVCQRLLMKDLSPEEKAKRLPLRPEVLANALQDKVHIECGRTRRVKATRVK